MLHTWFEKGATFEQYRTDMQVNQQEMLRVYEQVSFSTEDEGFFKELKQRKWRGIVLTADWCGDAALCVPIIQRMAEESEIPLRYLIRDENLELMDQYLTNGTSRAIPIFIFIDEHGAETRVWGPRSPEVQQLVTELRSTLPNAEDPTFQEKQQQMFKDFKAKINHDSTIWRTVIDSVVQRLK
ncbi:thioredoxin family protein [Bacillus horti]|uniref:Thioredoxin family protein n=1 Tax=Caldalkalibacillus horti TaxID=77523 RepID=A0ABT9VZ55_9BACI|nr:hypothetical protein [Bacillus horti]